MYVYVNERCVRVESVILSFKSISDPIFLLYAENQNFPTYPDLSRPHRPFPTTSTFPDRSVLIRFGRCHLWGGGLNQEVEYLPIILQIYKINGNSGFEL